MKTYYHVTLLNNLNSIMSLGLVPTIGTLSKLCDEKNNKVYLFPTKTDMETALSSWLGEVIDDTYGEQIECCSLEIVLPDDWPIQPGECEYEVYATDIIPAKYIKFFKLE